MQYGALVYGTASPTSLQPIVIQQKKICRAITNAGRHDHAAPLLSSLKIIPFIDLYMYRLLRCIHSSNINSDKYLIMCDLIDQVYNYPVRHQVKYKVPLTTKEYLRQSLTYTSPHFLNMYVELLPAHMSQAVVKHVLKESILAKLQ
jgi:hypothetical protein